MVNASLRAPGRCCYVAAAMSLPCRMVLLSAKPRARHWFSRGYRSRQQSSPCHRNLSG